MVSKEVCTCKMSVNKLSDILRDFNETGSCLVAWDNQEQGLLESAVQHLKQVHDNIVLENSQRLSLGMTCILYYLITQIFIAIY